MGMFKAIGDAWAEHGKPLIDKWTQAMDRVRSTIQNLYDKFLKPVIDKVNKIVQKLWNDHLEPICWRLDRTAVPVSPPPVTRQVACPP